MKCAHIHRRLLVLVALAGSLGPAAHAQVRVRVVNMVPANRSGETVCDAEPNLAVNPADPLQMAGSAFTPDPMDGPNAPIYVSDDGGATWALNSIVPGNNNVFGTGDITLRFGGASNVLYGGILRGDRPRLRMNILRTDDYMGPGAMTVLVDRTPVDQPYVQAATVGSGEGAGSDRVYVGNNNFGPGFSAAQTATVDVSLDAATAAAPAGFAPFAIETRTTATVAPNQSQDGPSIRPAIHADGTVYAAYFGWRVFGATTNTSDIVVVRDDRWGSGNTPFADLVEPGTPDGDGQAGVRVARRVTIPSLGTLLGTQRIGSALSIAVDPRDSGTVYLAWAEGATAADYTILVQRSKDRGVSWTGDRRPCRRNCEEVRLDCEREHGRGAQRCAEGSARCNRRCDEIPRALRVISPATNPALAVAADGTVGLVYQKLTGTAPNQVWETHLELSADGFDTKPTDIVLARTADVTAPTCGAGPLGDYLHLMALGNTFYGVFSADNLPDRANFPQGVTYQRQVDFPNRALLDNDGMPGVGRSSDPFFFRAALPPRLTVRKVVRPAGDPGRFNLRIDGNAVASNVGNGGSSGPVVVTAGRHTVSETAGTGTSLASYTTSFSGDCAPDGTVTVGEGEDRTCTITNLGRPLLTVNKVLTPAADPGRFNLQIDGAVVAASVGNGGSSGPQAVAPNVAHTVGETAAAGTSLASYTRTIGGDCNSAGLVTLAPGESKTCTISNVGRPLLTVRKILVHPDHNHLRLFNLQIDGVTVRANVNGGSSGPHPVTPGRHTVGETGGTGTSLGAFHAVIGGDCAADGTVTLAPGESKTCTITNYDNFGGCSGRGRCCEPGNGTEGCQLCVTPPRECP